MAAGNALPANQEVLLVPRLVYVPYSAHVPVGPARLPGSVAGSMNVPAEERMTVTPSHNDTLEQCLEQLKAMNTRLSELEARQSAAIQSSPAAPPQSLPLAPVQIPPVN